MRINPGIGFRYAVFPPKNLKELPHDPAEEQHGTGGHKRTRSTTKEIFRRFSIPFANLVITVIP
jgi:hypothetical protein